MENNILRSQLTGYHTFSNRLAITLQHNFSAYSDIESLEAIKYYSKYSKAGLIITEPTTVSPLNIETHSYPGIYNYKQLKAWRKITEAVHDQSGKIFLQMWHCGLRENSCLLDEKLLSAKQKTNISNDETLSSVPFRSKTEILEEIYLHFRKGTQNAIAAEFDGVEIHLCCGSLIDWIIHTSVDLANVDYFKDLDNRTQLLLGVIEEVANVIDEERVGVKISPSYKFLGLSDPDPEGTFYYLLDALNYYNLAYVHLIEPAENDSVISDVPEPLIRLFRLVCRKNIMLNIDDNLKGANLFLENGDANLVSCYNSGENLYSQL
jgi:N-ethylmaleimide reductase